MADDHIPPLRPRPRRRRTDIDPNAPTPPVAHERRRQARPTEDTEGLVAALGGAARPPAPRAAPPSREPVAPEAVGQQPVAEERAEGVVAEPPEPGTSTSFHVPGLAALAADESAVGTAKRSDVDEGTAPVPAETPEERPSWLAVLDDRSPNPDVCPFLRSTDGHGLIAPIEGADPANRCAALTEAVPQSLRQQELVCLTTGHVNCPRYLRGAAVLTETPQPEVRRGRQMSPAMLGSLVVLVMALTASVAFVLARGGSMGIGSTGSPGASAPVAVVSPTPASVASASPTSIAQVTPTPVPSPTSTPTATPSPTASPTPKPTRTPRPSPTSDRYELLRACPDTPRCYIYTVRRGDNVYSIARYFGVSQDSIYTRNPWLRSTGLRAGQELRLPPPTR